MKIGILALQGAFIEHAKLLSKIGVESIEVRLPEHLSQIDALILPGGESTTIGKLMIDFELFKPIQKFGEFKPIWGTCAGAILLAKKTDKEQPLLGLMDISIKRNAFGRQIDSFETQINMPIFNNQSSHANPFNAVFIRAPLIEEAGPYIKILSILKDGQIVAAQQKHLLATSFHPELTNDPRFHEYFISMINKNQAKA